MLRHLFAELPWSLSEQGWNETTRSRARFLSLLVRLLILVVLILLPWFGLVLYTGVEQRKLAVVGVQANALQLVRVVASNQAARVEAAHQLLTAFARIPELRRLDAAACSAFLAEMLTAFPQYLNFGVIEPGGNLICSAVPFASPLNLADRSYFQEAIKTRRFTIGEYQIGRVTGLGSFNYAMPILNAAGNAEAVIFAPQKLAELTSAVADVDLPEQAVLVVTDLRGVIMARVPDPGSWIGKTLPEKRVVEALAGQGGSGVFEAEDTEGVRRLWAHAALTADGKLHATIGIPKHVALADVHRLLVYNLTALGLASVLALVSAWYGGKVFILHQINALIATTTRLAAGDLGARALFANVRSELDLLARAFNDMAAALQTRTLELRTAEARTREAQIELAVTRAHMNIARQIQQAFLPRGPLMLKGVRFVGRCIPAAAVGGDYFGYFPRGKNGVDIFIGDVCGHGVGAALLMAEAHSAFTSERLVAQSAADMLSNMNDRLHSDLDRNDLFMTAFCAIYDMEAQELTYANAGHPPPLLLQASGMRCTPLDSDGLVLGVRKGVHFVEAKVTLQPEDIVLFYTDGVTERQGEAGDLFGAGRLWDVLRTCRHESPEAMIDTILAALQRFAGTKQPDDDVALVVMKLTS